MNRFGRGDVLRTGGPTIGRNCETGTDLMAKLLRGVAAVLIASLRVER